MMRPSRATLVLLIASVLVLAAPAVAQARVSEYQVQFSPIGDTGTMQAIVNVVLSPETKLPATVAVPIPTGATLLWAGEILGGDPAADPAREASVTATAGGQIVTFTLEKERTAQVEAALAAPSISGNTVKAPLSWVNTTEEGTYTFSVAIEAGVSDVKITPAPGGEPLRNDAGESLYLLTPVRLGKGQSFALGVEYKRGSGSSGTGGVNVVLIVALVGLALAVVALVVVLLRQRPAVAEAIATPAPAPQAGPEEDTTDNDFFSLD